MKDIPSIESMECVAVFDKEVKAMTMYEGDMVILFDDGTIKLIRKELLAPKEKMGTLH